MCVFLSAGTVFAYDYNQNSYALQNLNRAELILFGHNNNSDPYTRLALAEQRLFGTVQSGNFEQRVNLVNRVLENSRQNPNAYVANNNSNKINKLRYILNDVLNGQMTGYTPPVYYNNDPQMYYNTTIPQTMNAYGNRNFITQTRVLIDD